MRLSLRKLQFNIHRTRAASKVFSGPQSYPDESIESRVRSRPHEELIAMSTPEETPAPEISGQLSSPPSSSPPLLPAPDQKDTNLTMSSDLLHPLKPKCYSSTKRRWIESLNASDKVPPKKLRIISWNVDFASPTPKKRMQSIISYLESIASASSPESWCILLQEMMEDSLATLLSDDWVRTHFIVLPTSRDEWPQHSWYGNVTLVSRNLHIVSASILTFENSFMGRGAVIVDVLLRATRSRRRQVIRVANTHLESLPQGTSARPMQLLSISALLKEPGLRGGIVGGDMNAIRPSDRAIHVAAGLRDAYYSIVPDDESSYTWGYQPPSRFPPGRLDKVFYTGRELLVDCVQRIGVGLKTEHGQWVSDHYGLVTTLMLETK
ncbi:Tyrosyl-DNA phosphodiesterase 2 [Grifola frondosa]|uniref:Tyrosyl-DNA phosphodiesterase 2 n=1 Tax=Grifola frondosa TaxID=5627 RepID=A0A1C7M6L4_GRIFR|nr:Tyrosyl-DNA phosphodiesterase 2 [Grifola frondosa]